MLKSKGVLGPSGKRKYCWRKFWDDECEELFSEYTTKYRSNDEAWFCLLHNIEPPKCPICGNLCTFTGRLKSGNKGYNTVCENCSANSLEDKRIAVSETKKSYSKEKVEQIVLRRKKTNLERYGEENHMCYGSKSFRECMLKRYGDEFYSNRNKAVETNLKRYGVRCNFELPTFQEESIKKKIERYGDASNYSKTRMTNLERYGCEHISQVKEVQDKASASKKKHILKLESEYNCTHQSKLFTKYGQGWKSLDLDRLVIDNYIFIDNDYIPLIEQYFLEGTHTNKYVSDKEKQLVDYVKIIYRGDVLENVTNVVRNNNGRFYELDIYLPDLRIAIDFNGIYWHSDKFKDIYYHQRKLKRCYEEGILLIHIYEHDWDDNRRAIQDMLQNILNNPECSIIYNKIPVYLYNHYKLTEPEKIIIGSHTIYNEGKFIKQYE